MNVERLNAVADAIENDSLKSVHFSMRWFQIELKDFGEDSWIFIEAKEKFGHVCGTVACIAGYACLMRDGGKLLNSAEDWLQSARLYLDLDMTTADELFLALNSKYYGNLEEITAKQAVKTIRNLIATGEVVWE